MSYKEVYRSWIENSYYDKNTREELLAIKDNEKEIEDRFYRELEFGTGGMRGVIGAGTNRMNKYTIRKAAQGLANYLEKQGIADKGVAIAYDSRHCSDEFAMETALVMASNNIKAYLFDELRPTPELSFAVRYLGCAAGVVITASHNPKEYNGFKAYGSDGCQLPPKESDEVIKEVASISDLSCIRCINREEALEKGLIEIIGKEIDDAYIAELKKVCINPGIPAKIGSSTKIIYTPLHGTGNKPVRRILKEIGFEQVLVVEEQEKPDPDFSTVKYPNPEEKAVFNIAIEMAEKENVDLIIGTDPDADRVGVVVRNTEGEYITLTGNQTGCLLMEYILSQKKQAGVLPDNAFVIKTIVSSDLARKIAQRYGVEIIDVLTGFKFIGEQIRLLDDTGIKKFIFGFEESYGYLAGTHARDKDAVVASMLIAEVYAWYKSRGMSLYQGLLELFERYGYVKEGIDSFTLKGKEGLEKIESAMVALRNMEISKIGTRDIEIISDYERQEKVFLKTKERFLIDLPKSNVLHYTLDSGIWFCIRPSGTEPKIKIYYGVSSSSLENADKELELLKRDVLTVVKPLLE
ncbi:MAG: phospho-sugar mutase [Clostridiaceae bacterium]|jgi:phosphoglucomutase|nr:phospho-sugar mutase [Clostridiaceae bacterium]